MVVQVLVVVLGGIALAAGLTALRISLSLAVGAAAIVMVLGLAAQPQVRDIFTAQIAGLTAGRAAAVPSNAVRYRLMITLSANGKTLSGDVVQQVFLIDGGGGGLANFSKLITLGNGQAMVLDLPNGQVLIALMASASEGSYWQMFLDACNLNAIAQDDTASLIERALDFRGSCDVPTSRLPRFLVASGRNNPRSLRAVTPDQFNEVLGPGISFKGALVETTTAPLSSGIESILPWTASDAPENAGHVFLKGVDVGFHLYGTYFHLVGPK